MKRSLIKQFNLLILVTVIIYIVSAVSLYAFILRNVIDRLQEEILLSNAKEISYMVDSYVQEEILMLTRFANTQRSIKWLNDVSNEENYRLMEDALVTYSKLLKVDSLFIVDKTTKSYYITDKVGDVFQMPKLYEHLDESKEKDAWFFNTLELVDDYDVNIGKSLDSEALRLWINIVVISGNEKIGVVGCSLPIEDIINEIINKSVTQEKTYVVDELGAIQLSSRQELIQLDSYTESFDNGCSIYAIVQDSHLINDIEEFIQDEHSVVEIIDTHHSNNQSIVVAKIPSINWNVIHIYNGRSIIEIDGIMIGIAVLVFMSSLMGFLLVRFTRLKLLLPIREVREQVKTFERTSLIMKLEAGQDEIGLLATSIINMESRLQNNKEHLEKQLKLKEDEVHKLYKDISQNEKNLKRLLDALPIGVFRFNEKLEIVYCNESALLLFGVTSMHEYRKKLLKCRYYPFVSQEDKEHLLDTISKNQVLIDYRLELQISSFRQLIVLLNVYKVNIDGVDYYEGIMKDITKSIIYEKQLIKRANYDNLTGVLSRAAFINRLDEFLNYHYKEKAYSYFVTFDFDYFKMINDKFGHLAGDHVLKSVLDTITSLIGEFGIVGRVGGDEFAAVIWEVHENHIYDFLDSLRNAVEAQDINYDGLVLKITISIGYTICQDSDDFKVLYYRSDQALYEAKGLGKNRICANNQIGEL